MPTLPNYSHFNGHHWETGSICNALAYRGITAPHTGKPLTEALLMGISGGAVVGYFSFAYEGYDPHVALLTRNTFNPMDTILERLAVPQNIFHTKNAAKAEQNLLDAIENGDAPLVWADMFTLPYNALGRDDGMWQMYPVLVYGYEPDEDTVFVADRASVPLKITPDELATARARVKKDKYRLMTLDAPDLDRLPAAVQKGIWDCIKLYTEAPPKGSAKNFGFAALQRWADLLVKPKQKESWEKVFPRGTKMLAGLESAFNSIEIFGKKGYAERDVFAEFLDEAAVILGRPGLKETARRFRQCGAAWRELSRALLPDDVAPFKELREGIWKKQALFVEHGTAKRDEISAINTRLAEIRAAVKEDFPLSAAQVTRMREGLSEQILEIRSLEQEAVNSLQEAMV